MKFYCEEDLENGNFEKFCQEIEELSKKAAEAAKLLNESAPEQFNSIEEALKYYNAIPFSDWENKMRERHGI